MLNGSLDTVSAIFSIPRYKQVVKRNYFAIKNHGSAKKYIEFQGPSQICFQDTGGINVHKMGISLAIFGALSPSCFTILSGCSIPNINFLYSSVLHTSVFKTCVASLTHLNFHKRGIIPVVLRQYAQRLISTSTYGQNTVY